MKTRIFLAIMLTGLLTGYQSYAQVSAGVKGGLNLANLRGSSVQNNSMLMGYNFGGFGEYQLEDLISGDIGEKLSGVVELYVETKGAKADYHFLSIPDDPTSTVITQPGAKQNFTYVTIPLLARYNWAPDSRSDFAFFGEFGPYAGALFGMTVDGEKWRDDDKNPATDERKFREEYSGFDFGIIAGAGATYKLPFGGRKQPFRAIFNVRYELGLSNIGEYKKLTIDIPEEDLKNIKTSTIGISLGIAYDL